VTGSSRGLGAAIAGALGVAGWPVVLNFKNNAAAAERVRQRIAGSGGTAALAPFDVTDSQEIERGLAAAREQLGPISVLVNNATGPQPVIPVREVRWADFLAQLDYFVKAPTLLLQACLDDMQALGFGRVINIGSEVANLGNPEFGHYASAKAAQHGLTRSWANELGPSGITVNTVEPGWIPVERHEGTPQGETDDYVRGVPLGRQGKPEDVAAAVVFLASDGAGFITGQRVAVNGGNTLV
jgi:3-oxoacyl-[acyl-carrier protein] reductase